MTPLRAAAVSGVVLTLVSGFWAQQSEVARSLRRGQAVSGILLGTDLVDRARHSDTLMVWNYNPVQGQLDVLSIPRDTKIDLPGYRFRRVNEVFAYHFSRSGQVSQAAGEVISAVSSLLSLSGVPFTVKYFVHIDYQVFARIIDLLGGIRVHVDEPMHYDDNAGKLHIHWDPGDYRLNGSSALAYVRFRGQSGDRGRILRQMEFLKALLTKLSSPTLYIQGPRLVGTLLSHIRTNLFSSDMVFLILEAKHLRLDGLNPRLLPGKPAGALWEMDKERAALVLQQMQGTLAPLGSNSVKAEAGIVTIKVWNGTGRPGVALKVTRRLRGLGFDVLEWGNYDLRQSKTRVLDRVGDFGKAQSVARALGVGSVFSDINPKLRADVEVVVGDDYEDPPDGR